MRRKRSFLNSLASSSYMFMVEILMRKHLKYFLREFIIRGKKRKVYIDVTT